MKICYIFDDSYISQFLTVTNSIISNEKKIAIIEKIKGKKGRPKKTNKTGGAPFPRDNIIEYKKTSHSNTM